jgi:hypothetical protein
MTEIIATPQARILIAPDKRFPAGAIIFNAYVRLFGPWAERPTVAVHGHPHLYPAGHHDLNVISPEQAIANIALKWHTAYAKRHGLDTDILEAHHHVSQFEVWREYDTIDRKDVPLHKVFIVRHKGERALWEARGLDSTNVPEYFEQGHDGKPSWYIARRVR